jgi:malonyl CoA-acyl carrier protein transacylase
MYELKTDTPPPATRNHNETVVWREPIEALRDGAATWIDLGVLDDTERQLVRGRIKKVANAVGVPVRVYRDARGHSVLVKRDVNDDPQQAMLDDLP